MALWFLVDILHDSISKIKFLSCRVVTFQFYWFWKVNVIVSIQLILHEHDMCQITTGVCRWFFLVMLGFNSLAPGKFEWNFRHVIFKQILVIGLWGISCEIALIWMSLGFTDDQSTLVQVMAWCRQATSHYLSPCWPRSLSPYGVTRPQWVKLHFGSNNNSSFTGQSSFWMMMSVVLIRFKLNLVYVYYVYISISQVDILDQLQFPLHNSLNILTMTK